MSSPSSREAASRGCVGSLGALTEREREREREREVREVGATMEDREVSPDPVREGAATKKSGLLVGREGNGWEGAVEGPPRREGRRQSSLSEMGNTTMSPCP
jgi:hypothetical protein